MASSARLVSAALLAGVAASPTFARDGSPSVRLAIEGTPKTVFAAPRDGCDGNDVPDAPARAFRDAAGGMTLFGLHYDNRALRGNSFDALKIDCHVVYPSHGNADPAAYDDRSWIAATWTQDGRTVDALVHHEYQANEHPGRCRFPDYMQCWFNTVLAVRSTNGGEDFHRPATVVASAPYTQDAEQGRHRGFFNPSNIVSDLGYEYTFASTTGWAGQEGGVCLFRTKDPDKPGSWRAYDGVGWTVAYPDPYRSNAPVSACATVAPFPAPVGSVVRDRVHGVWLATFQAKADAGAFPVSGFYFATGRDLLHWSLPHLLLPGATLYDDPCRSGGSMIAYPSVLDPDAKGRNFDDVGVTASLFYVTLAVEGCTVTGRRSLMRQILTIERSTKN